MDFALTSKQEQFRDEIRAFFSKEIAPGAARRDEKGEFPYEDYGKLAAKGYAGLIIPSQFGGRDGGTMEYSILTEEIARADAGMYGAFAFVFHLAKTLLMFGTEEQKARFLPRISQGGVIGAVAISEPHVGSSFKSMKTTAAREDGCYVLNGTKTHINNGKEATLMFAWAKAERGLTCFLLERDLSEWKVLSKHDPISMRASPVYTLKFENYKVPEGNVINREGGGLEVFTKLYNFARIGHASAFIGIASAALDGLIDYGSRREVGARYLTDFQGVRWIIVDLAAKLEAAKLIRDRAAWAMDRGEDNAKLTSMAKLVAGEAAQEITLQACQLSGGVSCYRNVPFERYLREVRLLNIAGGAQEIMRETIARQILGKPKT